jgi:capsular exopolysaccharide synthesis family protein
MSLIFDALQRSEGERKGADASSVSTATELLELVEQQAISDWGSEADNEFYERKKKNVSSIPIMSSASTAITDSVESVSALNYKQLDQLAQFKSIEIPHLTPGESVRFVDKESLAAEKFRFLGVRLRQIRRERSLKKLLITGSLPQEGKSTVAVNVAGTLARKEQGKVLLLEGDVRRPSLSEMFGARELPGLCNWLEGAQRQVANIYFLEEQGFWIMPAGSSARNPLELLQSGRLSVLMDQLATLFDWIIIDSPPLLPLADTSVWSRLTDGILLVTRQGATEKRQLQRSLAVLDHKKLVGAVVNSSSSPDHEAYGYYSQFIGQGALDDVAEEGK